MEENKNAASETLEENAAAENEEKIDADAVTDESCEEKPSRQDKKKLKKAEEYAEELGKKLEDAEKQLAEANDKYMRLYAEYDNFRRRSQKEKEATYTDAYVDALTQILPVLDNLERAAQFSGEDAESPLAKGLELTLKSFAETMEKMGVAEIPALGEKFDPNVHNAVLHVDDDAYGEGEIIEVFQKGYRKGKHIIRFAMVKTAN